MKEKKGRLPFRQLTWTDRLRLEKLLKEGHKPQEIANTLHVHHSRDKKRENEATGHAAAGDLCLYR